MFESLPIGRSRVRMAACSIAVIGFGFFSMTLQAQSWNNIRQRIHDRFPTVPAVSTAELAEWMSSTNRRPPVLVDARAEKEFDVSHLRGALRATSAKAVLSWKLEASQSVVVYCSVGWRSAVLTEELRRTGLTNVFNLEGSLFAWANEGRPVYRGSNQVFEVHPYDSKWGRLLDQRWHSSASRTGVAGAKADR